MQRLVPGVERKEWRSGTINWPQLAALNPKLFSMQKLCGEKTEPATISLVPVYEDIQI
jgi:hypothetical protein